MTQFTLLLWQLWKATFDPVLWACGTSSWCKEKCVCLAWKQVEMVQWQHKLIGTKMFCWLQQSSGQLWWHWTHTACGNELIFLVLTWHGSGLKDCLVRTDGKKRAEKKSTGHSWQTAKNACTCWVFLMGKWDSNQILHTMCPRGWTFVHEQCLSQDRECWFSA